ncbi:YIP1 family protein [Thalassococcus sp. CAU 1522]|uniref:YIP1 family protein n=1 Tax=Thalassococcus arenae TaxID=2851652 RepID=A0ABS6NBN9_9RHOB|nr:YIP1 family protein [Thalassococcus arenae]MBV2361198.1 YIP1 family protein [Thalassococcus arenae]
MPVARDIAASYLGPGAVVGAKLARGPREDRSLAFLMGACALIFVAQWPRLAREAHLADSDLNAALGGALMGWIFVAPLFFYALAAASQIVLHLLGRRIDGAAARLALFWALLASAPMALLNGLAAGFIGPGPALNLTGLVWLGVFVWFWLAGLRAARIREQAA